jgi:hypothetical protein
MTDEIPTKASAYDSVSKLLRLEDGYWEQITMLAIKESMKRRRRYSVNQLLHDTLTQALKLRPLDVIEREREDARAKYIAEQATKAAGGGESDAASADNDGDMMFDASTIDFDDTDR